MEGTTLQLVSDLGSRLLQASRSNKDFLIKLLRQAASDLSQIEQPLINGTANKQQAMKPLEAAIKPLKKSIIKHGLLNHRDKEVRLLVTICVSEIFRILAPEPPFEDKYLRDIFNLFLSAFMELSDTSNTYFSRRAKILETVSRCKCCVIMLDLDCHDLVNEMFNIFFSVIRDHHQQSLINDILSIMTDIIEEEANSSLVDVILQNLVKKGKDVTCAASNLASSLIQSCTNTLQPFICSFLASCFVEEDTNQSNLKESYHEIIYKISQDSPQMLLALIPNLTQELLTDQVDVRMKALNLTGKIFALPQNCFAEMHRDLFIEFLKRFSDTSAEIRMAALKGGKQCYMANPSGTESSEILIAIQERLLDFDDRVRMQALIIACDIVMFNMKYVPVNLLSEASERLRDKKISIRKKALQKLTEVYRDYCDKCSEGCMMLSDQFEQIICKILLLCCDKDCQEFRAQTMELVLSDELFPRLLPVEERIRHWIHLFSLLSPLHLKSLNSILSQKRRLQTEMQYCLALWKEEKDYDLDKLKKNRENSFVKMSTCFPDSIKAEESFHRLDQTREKPTLDALTQLLNESSFTNARIIREKFLKSVGDEHPLHEFLRVLSAKCSPNIFSSEHVQFVLNQLCSSSSGSTHLKASLLKFLLVVLNMFPSYTRGSEEEFLKVLEENESATEELMEVLSKAAPHISSKFCDLFQPILERICMEGTRSQAKYAVTALAALIGSSKNFDFTEFCEVLLDSLQCEGNIPTILQSLGCIGQYSVSAFESVYGVIRSYIYTVFQAEPSEDQTPCDLPSSCCNSCKLKIYGLKTLVRSFLPRRGQVTRKIADLLKILEKTLKSKGRDGLVSCDHCGAFVRLAAAKAVLQLSRKWDLHISPALFHLTIFTAKESDATISRLFLDKVHKLLKEHIIPNRYACAFPFAIAGPFDDLHDYSLSYMKEFTKVAGKRGGSLTDSPAYIIVFLIHVLAHDPDFPREDCTDDHTYARFCGPLFSVLQMLVSTKDVDPNTGLTEETVLYLLCIFRAIKRAQDTVESSMTPRLHVLANIGFSAVNALNHSVITSPRAPRSVLLPSSLYRLGLINMSDNQDKIKPYAWIASNHGFIQKIIQNLQSKITLPALPFTKHGEKGDEDNMQVVLKDKNMPLVSCNLVETSTNNGTKVNMKETRGSRKRIHIALPETSTKPVNDSSKRAKTRDRNQVSSRNEAVSSKDSCSKSTNSRVSSVLKDISNQEDDIVGQRIRLLSPTDGRFYSGTVEGFNSKSNSHKIAYDNGDVELVCLDSESWETLSQDSLQDKVMLRKERDESFGSKIHISQNFRTRSKVTKPVAEKKNKKLAGNSMKGNIETSGSLVTNIHDDST